MVQDPANNNNGTATWTYSVADGAFDFLAAGEMLTLTYTARVDNNFAPNNEFTDQSRSRSRSPAPTTCPSSPRARSTYRFRAARRTPGGDLPTSDPTSGTLAFTDVDLTDTHTVPTALRRSALLDGVTECSTRLRLPPGPLDLLKPR